MPIERLQQGGDVRKNWRTTNQMIAQQEGHARTLHALTHERRQIYGGGVGSLRTYLVKEKIGDVLICRSWDGTTEGTEDVPVAVNRNSRQLGGETIAGTAYTYSSYTAIDGFNDSRNSGDGSTNETQIVTPMWYLDCEIDVMATNYSGVTFDDTINPPYDLKLIEVSARCWAKVEE